VPGTWEGMEACLPRGRFLWQVLALPTNRLTVPGTWELMEGGSCGGSRTSFAFGAVWVKRQPILAAVPA
jgi:hypothetical protein